jgi:hypothetical protein
MKYLVIARPKAIPIPLDQAVKLYEAAMAWMDNSVKSGNVDCSYVFPGGGGIAIANVNSQEEAFDVLFSYPLYGFFDWQVEALADWKHAYTTIIEAFKKLGAQ